MQGSSLTQVAATRGLLVGSILNHLLSCIKHGKQLDLTRFASDLQLGPPLSPAAVRFLTEPIEDSIRCPTHATGVRPCVPR
jgi:Helix-turn-helix domain